MKKYLLEVLGYVVATGLLVGFGMSPEQIQAQFWAIVAVFIGCSIVGAYSWAILPGVWRGIVVISERLFEVFLATSLAGFIIGGMLAYLGETSEAMFWSTVALLIASAFLLNAFALYKKARGA